jgi:hypothetical protein
MRIVNPLVAGSRSRRRRGSLSRHHVRAFAWRSEAPGWRDRASPRSSLLLGLSCKRDADAASCAELLRSRASATAAPERSAIAWERIWEKNSANRPNQCDRVQSVGHPSRSDQCVLRPSGPSETPRTQLKTQRSRIRILSSLPAETRPEGFARGGCHAAREHGSTCQLSALPHGAAARTTVCMFGSLKPSDRSSGLRSFGLSEADHSGSLSGSRPMQQRLVCVEAGQTFSIHRVKVLMPQISSVHCCLTRGHWFDPSRDHHRFLQVKRLGVGLW